MLDLLVIVRRMPKSEMTCCSNCNKFSSKKMRKNRCTHAVSMSLSIWRNYLKLMFDFTSFSWNKFFSCLACLCAMKRKNVCSKVCTLESSKWFNQLYLNERKELKVINIEKKQRARELKCVWAVPTACFVACFFAF